MGVAKSAGGEAEGGGTLVFHEDGREGREKDGESARLKRPDTQGGGGTGQVRQKTRVRHTSITANQEGRRGGKTSKSLFNKKDNGLTSDVL